MEIALISTTENNATNEFVEDSIVGPLMLNECVTGLTKVPILHQSILL